MGIRHGPRYGTLGTCKCGAKKKARSHYPEMVNYASVTFHLFYCEYTSIRLMWRRHSSTNTVHSRTEHSDGFARYVRCVAAMSNFVPMVPVPSLEQTAPPAAV